MANWDVTGVLGREEGFQMRTRVSSDVKPPKKRVSTSARTSHAVTAVDRQPLVFISHHSSDTELAGAFGNLLAGLTAGTLRYFRSSDHKPGKGIDFGKEWFAFIMDVLGKATHVVALFTNASIDKPWILFEAGVAKGRPDDVPVFGLFVGLPLATANTGPFAQFQNCEDDEDALTKLVLELISSIPGSNPLEDVVRRQVATFRNEVQRILETRSQSDQGDAQTTAEENVPAKLFEEIKVMLRDLPDEIRGRKRRRMHPFMFEEMMHMHMGRGGKSDPAVAWLMFISMFRDECPWFYELGLDVYRALRRGNRKAAHIAAMQIREIAEFTMRGPWGDEFGIDPDIHMMLRHMPEMLDRYLRLPEPSERGTEEPEGE